MTQITKNRLLRQVTAHLQAKTCDVQWATQLREDGVLIAETFDRKAYAAEQSAELAADLPAGMASPLHTLLGWSS